MHIDVCGAFLFLIRQKTLISHKYGLLGHTEMHKHKGETSSYAAENNVKTKKKSICKEYRKANPNCLFCEGFLIK